MTRVILTLTILFSCAVFAGGIVGNGGDVLDCGDAAGLKGGRYVVDYLMARGRGFQAKDFRAVRSWGRSQAPILDLLARVAPNHVGSFTQFVADQTGSAKWTGDLTPLTVLVQFDDSESQTMLPQSCLVEGQPIGARSIERDYDTLTGTVTYHFDPVALRKLEIMPLQLSILLVHEWLWNFTSELNQNRKISAMLFLKNPPEDELKTFFESHK